MHCLGERVVGEGLLDLDGLAGVDEFVDVRWHDRIFHTFWQSAVASASVPAL
jgi:hypothetical protein